MMELAEKTVFVCFYEAYPPDSGAGSVSYNTALYKSGERMLLQVCDRDETVRLERGLVVRSLDAVAGTKTGKILWLNSRINKVVDVLVEYGPSVVVLEGASWALYHYLLLVKIRRTLPEVKVIYHAHNVEYELRRQKNGPVIAAVTKWAEKRVLSKSDRCYAVSGVDADIFQRLYGVQPELLPNGVDVQRYASIEKKEIEDARVKYGIRNKALLFMGLYAYKPNTEAVDFLVKEIMPVLLERQPEIQLVVTGGKVPYSFPWLVNPGMVPYDDVPLLLRGCAIGLAPVFSGSGTRLKILEYMAGGLPVVATAKGAEGIDAENGVNILLSDAAGDFTESIVQVLSDAGLASLLSQGGTRLVRAKYDWPAVVKVLDA